MRPVEYDLVILGGTWAGRLAAIATARTGARAALVEPAGQWQQQQYLRYLRQRLRQAPAEPWSRICTWARLATESQDRPYSLTALAAQGVDVIVGTGQFQPGHRLVLQVLGAAERQLSARSCLIVSGTCPAVLAGVSPDTLLSLAALGQRETLPPRLALIGGAQATAVEWAQGLRQHGIEVTLILDQDRFLPAEDPDLRRLISAQLAALGIPLLPRSQIDKIEPQDGVVHLWVGDRCFTVDALVAAGVGQPRVEAMGLDAMGIVHHPGGILVNARLQTSHPRVYAAGSVLGGEDRLALALPEVQVAVLNALFWPGRQMPYQHAAYGLETLPEVGRVGLTEPQARRLYGEDVQIFQGSAVPLSPTTAVDFCKLISQPNGRLLGAHLIGEGAIALAQMLAVGLKQGLTVDAIVKDRPLGAVVTQPAVSHTLAGVLHQAADQKRQQQWHIGAWRRDWAENWFNWRRSRS